MSRGSSYYVVLNDLDITFDMVEESVNGHETYRRTLDGTQSILKFNKKHPNTMSGRIKYTHIEILQFLTTNSVTWENTQP